MELDLGEVVFGCVLVGLFFGPKYGLGAFVACLAFIWLTGVK